MFFATIEMRGRPIETGKITAVYGKQIRVYYQGKEYSGQIRGKIYKEKSLNSYVAAGDNVEISFDSEGKAVIESVLPRKQFLVKPDILYQEQNQILAANLDQLIIVTSAVEPAFKAGLIDRFLVSAEKEHLQASIVINKIDLASPDEFAPFAEAWRKLGYNVLFTSAKTGFNLDPFKQLLKDKTSALAGHSGVGKSSLLNLMQPDLILKTAKISKSSGRGVHTTTSITFYPLPCGGWVADTPGLKVFGLTGITPQNLYRCFPEFRERNFTCRFSDCQHINEPGCGIKDAVESGEIFQGRYDSYCKLWEQLNQSMDQSLKYSRKQN